MEQPKHNGKRYEYENSLAPNRKHIITENTSNNGQHRRKHSCLQQRA